MPRKWICNSYRSCHAAIKHHVILAVMGFYIENVINITAYYFQRRQWHPTPILLPGGPVDRGAWLAAVHGVTRSWLRLSDFTFTFHFHALEKEMATHSSVLAWRISGTGEPGGLPSMGSHRVGHDWSDLAAAAAAAYYFFLSFFFPPHQFPDQGLNLGHGSESLES